MPAPVDPPAAPPSPPVATSEIDDVAGVVAATSGELRAFLAGLGLAPTDVDDVAQEAYVRWLRAPERRPAGTEPIAWLKGIARHVAHDHFRRQARRGAALGAIADALAGDAVEDTAARAAAAGDAAAEAMARCLAELPEPVRALVTARYADAVATETLAVRVGRSVETVRRIVRRARDALRACVERRLAGGGR